MTSIKLMLTGAQAWASVTGPLTSGMVGIPVAIEYDEAWEGLTKNLMCRCSPWGSADGEYRAILNVGEAAAVAHEVMLPETYLYLGVEGFSSDGTLVMPTTWAYCGKIAPGANTCEDPSTDPELTVWNQLQAEMEKTKEYVLTPEQAVNIQTYAQEARQAAEEAKQAAASAGGSLYYIPVVSQPTDDTLKFEFKPSLTGFPIPKPVTVELPAGSCSGEHVTLEPAEDDIPKVFFAGTAPAAKAEDELPLTMEYISKTTRIFSYVTLKVQGDTSSSYALKNFNLKLFSDEARSEKLKLRFRSWQAETHKYCLKKNWIDITNARNVVNGRLWGQVVKTRADYADYPAEYRESSNCGAVDGFPVKVYLNGAYQGLYTWNIRKDESMFNMDDSTGTHAALIADGNNTVTIWRESPAIDGSDWTDELNDTVPDAVKTAFRSAYSFVMESTDEEFKANIGQYFYKSSLIDYYIFIYAILMIGGLAKSQTMLTYDAQRFLANIYDMDTTWRLMWNGGGFYDVETACPDGYIAQAGLDQSNLLYERLVANFYLEIRERYNELRSGPLSNANILNEFERFSDPLVAADLYTEEVAATTPYGPSRPSGETNTIQHLRQSIIDRMNYCDEQFAQLRPAVPATGISLSASTLTFTEAVSQTLTATVEPGDTTDTVIWKSSDESVAKVSGGIVVPVAGGSATITATAGSVSAVCAVTVDIEVVEEAALYPLVNGSNQTATGVVTAEVTNGDHVKLVNTGDATVSGLYYNFANITAGTLGSSGAINNQEKRFSLSAGDVVVLRLSGTLNPDWAVGWRQANNTASIAELASNSCHATDFTREFTLTADHDVGAIFVYGGLNANTTYEFDVSLRVNGEKYI